MVGDGRSEVGYALVAGTPSPFGGSFLGSPAVGVSEAEEVFGNKDGSFIHSREDCSSSLVGTSVLSETLQAAARRLQKH
jgi:hypothetical protein